jgi:hypothetical protein
LPSIRSSLRSRLRRRIYPLAGVSAVAVSAIVASQASAAGHSASAPAVLQFQNARFSDGESGWTFTTGTGIGTTSFSGTNGAFLDPGTDNSVSQTVTATGPGTYAISAWITTGGAGGTMSVSSRGRAIESMTLPSEATFARYSLSDVPVQAGEPITLQFGSAPAGTMNISDISVSPALPNRPQVTSSNPEVTAMFNWAVAMADSYVQEPGWVGPVNIDEQHKSGTGTEVYSNTYAATLPYRYYYYVRDSAHQAEGAQLLGLSADNETMLRSFAQSALAIGAAGRYYPVWSMNFNAKTYGAIDYTSPTNYVRELPDPFELVQRIDDAYLWTGDKAYLNDPVLWNYVVNTMTKFIAANPGPITNPIPIPEADSQSITAGIATYNEQSNVTEAEAGDGVASQYAAYVAAADLAAAKGDTALATQWRGAAAQLKQYFNSTWSVDPSEPGSVVYAYTTTGQPLTGWGSTASMFIPLKGIMDSGPRLQSYLSFINSAASGPDLPPNIEATTYLPDLFLANGEPDTAWQWMQYIYNHRNDPHEGGQYLNGDYPDVSFTLVSQIIAGFLGITPDAPQGVIATANELPSTVGSLGVSSVPVGNGTVAIHETGQTSASLTNNSAATTYSWKAGLPGVHSTLLVNGKPQAARTEVSNGATYSYVTVQVAPHQSASVRS